MSCGNNKLATVFRELASRDTGIFISIVPFLYYTATLRTVAQTDDQFLRM